MKKILFFVLGLWPMVSLADTANINWYVDGSVYDTSTCTIGGDLILPTAPTKRGHTFLGWQSYIPIEYIESTGTQYIDTGFNPNQNTRVVMEYMVSSNVRAEGWIFCARNGGTNRSFAELYAGDGWWRTDYGNSQTAIVDLSSDFYNNKLLIDKNKSLVILWNEHGNEITRKQSPSNNFQTDFSLTFPCGNSGGSVTCMQNGTIRVYSFKLYHNGTLIRDMIPMLDPNGVACMYDRVEAKYYYNAGTGDFIAGPVAQ